MNAKILLFVLVGIACLTTNVRGQTGTTTTNCFVDPCSVNRPADCADSETLKCRAVDGCKAEYYNPTTGALVTTCNPTPAIDPYVACETCDPMPATADTLCSDGSVAGFQCVKNTCADPAACDVQCSIVFRSCPPDACPALDCVAACDFGRVTDPDTGCETCTCRTECPAYACPAMECAYGRKTDSNNCPTCDCEPCPPFVGVTSATDATCPYGVETDANGCFTGVCREAPCDAVCAIYCPYGNVKDAAGCPTCQCKECPAVAECTQGRPVLDADGCPSGKCTDPCPAVACDIYCPYGAALDANACPTCECNVDPCSLVDCATPTSCPDGTKLVKPEGACCGSCIEPTKCADYVCPDVVTADAVSVAGVPGDVVCREGYALVGDDTGCCVTCKPVPVCEAVCPAIKCAVGCKSVTRPGECCPVCVCEDLCANVLCAELDCLPENQIKREDSCCPSCSSCQQRYATDDLVDLVCSGTTDEPKCWLGQCPTASNSDAATLAGDRPVCGPCPTEPITKDYEVVDPSITTCADVVARASSDFDIDREHFVCTEPTDPAKDPIVLTYGASADDKGTADAQISALNNADYLTGSSSGAVGLFVSAFVLCAGAAAMLL